MIVVRTNTANTASVLAALRRLGVTPEVSEDADVVASAERVLLPGVGSFGAAADELSPAMADALRQRVHQDRPLLAICVGLQLLARSSEESPGAQGLAVVDAEVVRLRQAPRVPHLGWNRVTPTPGARVLTEGHAYFAHSFHYDRLPEGWQGAYSDHGPSFVAAIERGAVLGCQFHPELSGAWGRGLLERWLEATC
jgi:imidazole glycerol phosphate synthase glutamine amidotransferase subunit